MTSRPLRLDGLPLDALLARTSPQVRPTLPGVSRIEPLAGEGQQRKVIVDDDSGGLEVRVGTAESARPVGDVAGRSDQGGIERGVLGEIELPVYERSDDLTAGRSFNRRPGIKRSLLGLGQMNSRPSHTSSVGRGVHHAGAQSSCRGHDAAAVPIDDSL